MRLTIERMRTLVLAAGAVLLVALVGFLAIAKWKNPFNRRDLPQRLGLNIQQEANGWTYTHEQRGHTLYKIHASKLIQLKKGSNVLLHDVKIELYGEDGSRTDRIEGAEFEYDPQSGIATATGEVEITLMRPGVAPAIAPKATANQALGDMPKSSAIALAAQTASTGEIRVKTSGLIFEQKTGVAHTSERVQFALKQGTGSSMGASYDSQNGLLVLDRNVELNAQRGPEPVNIRAQHAEFERDAQVCHMRSASARYRGGEANAGLANVVFRDDGSAVRLDASGGFSLSTATGGHLAAPTGSLEFDEHNQPRHGFMQGGVTLDSINTAPANSAPMSRKVHIVSPVVDLQFTARGELHHAHLERGVQMHSETVSESAGTGPLRVNRTWLSPVADVDFRNSGRGQAEPSAIHGAGGVVVTGETQRGNGPVSPSRLSADEVTGQFGPASALSAMTGLGHVSMEETSVTGGREATAGDRLEAHFAEGKPAGRSDIAGAQQIESATIDGHVVLTQWPAPKAGAAADMLRATAGRAVYEGAGEWLHLTIDPRIENGGLQLTADKIDVSQASGDAFAHGNVKASWLGNSKPGAGKAVPAAVTFGGDGPAHAISAEAQLQQRSGVATFRGKARLWQQANSVMAPVIVLDRERQTLLATGSDAADPVRVVLLSAQRPEPGKRSTPSVVRVRGGDLKYSDAERRAVMHAGTAGKVVAETSTATSSSNEADLVLLPAGNHAGKNGAQTQVDRLTARGRVTIVSGGRRGTGEQLVYTSETEEYVLTGTASDPPRMSDPARGTVTGEALIFHGRDDSVSAEGGGHKTLTETTAPK